ncbi:hypothetical protein B9Y74_05620 [Stenotrophomonas maltophilia]|nr:hypothetical protein B9Y74_05620 [Stenotrophomonas maltophilia]
MNQEFVEVMRRQKRAQRGALRLCEESWYRKDAVTDEVWLLAHIGSTSAIAKMRLKSAIRSDRQACGDGKWVKVSEGMYFSWPMGEPEPVFIGCKPRYRWERRR